MSSLLHQIFAFVIIGYLWSIFVFAASTQEYIIFPRSSITQQETIALRDVILRTSADGKIYSELKRGGSGITMFWTTILSEAAFRLLKAHPLVQDINVNEDVAEPFGFSHPITANYTLSSAPAFATQRSAPPELRVISQPPGEADIAHYENYVYRKTSSPSYIYHAELGIDPRHLDFWGRPIEWLFTRRTINLNENTRTENPRARGHSTCTASKAAGRIYGASKSAKLVIVKMSDFKRDSVAGIMGTIFDHIVSRRRQGRSVVNVSWGSSEPLTGPLPPEWQLFLDSCRDLESISVPIFTAASNFALKPDYLPGSTRRKIDTVPALFYKQLSNLYTIGNCDNYGYRNAKSQDDTTDYIDQIHAPGNNVACPVSGDYWGASFAAPLVAGVVADCLSEGALSNSDLQKLLFEHASWPRHDGGKRVIWNMVDAAHNPPLHFAPGIQVSNTTGATGNTTAIS